MFTCAPVGGLRPVHGFIKVADLERGPSQIDERAYFRTTGPDEPGQRRRHSRKYCCAAGIWPLRTTAEIPRTLEQISAGCIGCCYCRRPRPVSVSGFALAKTVADGSVPRPRSPALDGFFRMVWNRAGSRREDAGHRCTSRAAPLFLLAEVGISRPNRDLNLELSISPFGFLLAIAKSPR